MNEMGERTADKGLVSVIMIIKQYII